jgi:hypothetical protein
MESARHPSPSTSGKGIAMKSLGLAVLSTCALLAALAAPRAFEARLEAAEQERLWFSELPPKGTPVNLTSLIARRRRAGIRRSRIVAAARGEVRTLSTTGASSDPLFPFDGHRGPINIALGSFSADPSNPDPVLLAAPGDAGDFPLVLFDLREPPVRLGDVPIGTIGPGGLSLATGNITGDAGHEIFVSGGPERPGHIRIIDLNRDDDRTFAPFGDVFDQFIRSMAAGDFDGNGRDELAVGHPTSGEVKVFEFLDGLEPREVGHGFPYGPSPSGGVFVSAADVNNDGVADLITGAGSGESQIRIFDVSTPSTQVLGDFVAFPPARIGRGVRVSTGEIDGRAVVAAVSGPEIRIFSVDPEGNWVGDPFAPTPFGPDPNMEINLQFFTPR